MDKIVAYSWLSKLSRLLFVLIIFFSATQLGLHFWPPSSLVYGIRIDYLSPTLYFLDILIILYLAATKFRSLRDFRHGIGTSVIPLLLTNLLYSQNPLATISWSLHFLLYLSFALEFRSFSGLQRSARQIGTSVLSTVLSFSLFFQFLLAITQISLGHSVGGLMYYLGERNIAIGSPGIALGTFMDQVVLRPYGTFSHPNILAGYTVICFLLLIRLDLSSRTLLKRKTWLQAKLGSAAAERKVLNGIPLLLSSLLVLLTQSRAADLALFGIIIPFYLVRSIKARFGYIIIIAICLLQFNFLSPARSDLSILQRLDLQQVSLKVIKNYPVFGTGVSASIVTYPTVSENTRLLQPDHNSFTLFLSWFGLFGVLAIIYYLKNCLRFDYWNLIIIFPLLLLDHYLLTSPQGLFMLILYFNVIWHSDLPTHRRTD